MVEIKADRNGKFSPQAVEFLQGQYTFIERLKRRGVGSSKVVYEAGISAFDNLLRGLETEIAFASFELQKNGLIVRLNINQRLGCVGITLTEIESINLISCPAKIKRGLSTKRKIIHTGKLEFRLYNGTLRFAIRELEYTEILKFFTNAGFAEKFRFSVSLDEAKN